MKVEKAIENQIGVLLFLQNKLESLKAELSEMTYEEAFERLEKLQKELTHTIHFDENVSNAERKEAFRLNELIGYIIVDMGKR